MWEGVADRLPYLRLIGMDKRGHGLSATPAGDWMLDDLAADVLALMDHLGVNRASVAGCSIGGMIAQRMATLAPSRIAGLFLSNTAMKVGTDESWAVRIKGVTEQGLRGMAPQIMERWFAPAFRATDEARAWETMLMRGDDAGYISTCRVLAAADLRTSSPTIACPVVLVGGTADASTPEDLVRATAAAINGARVEIIPGAGHIPAIDNPDATARLLADFLRELA
jgi:3-oxoadipate enol-lactonase